MKDPLTPSNSAYSILGIPEDADRTAINTAFKKALGDPAVPDKSAVKNAHSSLGRSQDRAVYDLFLYNDRYLESMAPDLLSSPSILTEDRASTARSLAEAQKEGFPNYAASHSLAVLYYHWAILCQKQPASSLARSSPPADELWKEAIAHWVYLQRTPGFWDDWFETKKKAGYFTKTPENLADLKNRISSRLESGLSSNPGAKLYYDQERRTADLAMAESIPFKFNGKVIPCTFGRLMMDLLGVREEILAEVRTRMARSSSPHLIELEELLDDFGQISGLLGKGKNVEAWDEFRRVPVSSQTSTKGKQVKVRILNGLGTQTITNNLDDNLFPVYQQGFQHYSDALETGVSRDDTLKAAASAGIEVADRNITDSSQSEIEREQFAVRILEIVVGLYRQAGKKIPDELPENFKKKISSVYTELGIHKKDTSPNISSSNRESILATLHEARDDLKKALCYDPTSTRAKKEFRDAEDLLEMLDRGFTPEGRDEPEVKPDRHEKERDPFDEIDLVFQFAKAEVKRSPSKGRVNAFVTFTEMYSADILERTHDLDRAMEPIFEALSVIPWRFFKARRRLKSLIKKQGSYRSKKSLMIKGAVNSLVRFGFFFVIIPLVLNTLLGQWAVQIYAGILIAIFLLATLGIYMVMKNQ